MKPLHVFFGHDERQIAGTTVFMRSVMQHARRPVALIPITSMSAVQGLREGTNAFTYRRFLVPWLMGWNGMAIFVDGADMLCRADINELADLYNPFMAVQVVRHEYTTRHPMKYCGTTMEASNIDYPRKNYASCMIINCSHFSWRHVTPDYIDKTTAMHMLQLEFIQDRYIGELPAIWNWLVDENGPNDDAKICHWTAGIPGISYYKDAPMAEEWHTTLAETSKVQV